MDHSKNIISLFILLALQGCAENRAAGNRDKPATQSEVAEGKLPELFSTRLTSTLLIAGDKCLGDETTGTFGNGETCDAGQYLIYIDDVNICSGTICTNNTVTPIIAELNDMDARLEGQKVYEIEAKSVTTQEQEDILETVLVNSDSLGNGTVFFR
jgi:hypothetical protein